MRLVEAVIGELGHEVEDLGGLVRRDAALHRALLEDGALLLHLLLDLLAHGAAQQVGRTQAVARQVLGDLHHLFLVDHDAVGLGQHAHQRRMRRLPGLAVLALAIGRDVGHRARAVQRDRGDQVLEAVDAHLPEAVAHARAFELEHPGGVALAQHLEGLRIVQRQGGDVDLDPLPLQDRQRLLDHRQRLQAEEVELHQAGLLDILHRVLGDQHVGPRVAVERHDLDQRLAADHHAGGVGRGVAVQALELQGDLQQPVHLLVVVAQLLQLRLALDRLGQGHRLGRVERDQLGDAVDLAIGQAEHAADVAHRRLGLQLAEGDDLGDPVGAVFAADVVDHLVAAVLAEVDVEVGHRHAFRVEEPLEQQAEAQRVEVGDRQRPGGDRPGARAAAGPDRDGLRLGPLDEVGDDQEVAGEAHLVDDAELVVEPRAVGRARRLLQLQRVEPDLQAARRHVAHRLGLGHAGADLGADRQLGLAAFRHHGAAAGDGQRVVAGLRQVGEELAHGLGRLEPVVDGDAAAVLLGQRPPLGDAEQRVMRLMHPGVAK